MNWYKRITAMPLVEKNKPMNYQEIGHNEFFGEKETGEQLWFMDNKYQIKSYPAKEGQAHESIYPGFQEIAKGRYEPLTHTTSVVPYFTDISAFNVRKREYVLKQIANALDTYFNNPKIVKFE